MSFSLKSFNQECAKHGVELVKGDGYFYWDGAAFDLWPSEPVVHFCRMPAARWREVLRHNLATYPLETKA